MRPEWFLTLLLSVSLGALFHLWRGRTFRDLLFYTCTAVIGFVLGNMAGEAIKLDILTVGRLHVLEATLVSCALTLVATRLKV